MVSMSAVDLGIGEKIKNIEATEKVKRELLENKMKKCGSLLV